MSEVKVTLITKIDGPAVAEHLSKAFCQDEPIHQHFAIGVEPSFLEMCADLIDQGISLKAVNENGEIVGVFLSEFIEKSNHHSAQRTGNTGIRTLYEICHFMEVSANIFGHNPVVDTYVDGGFLSVDRNYRSHGIGSKLFAELIALCKERNIPILKVFCSSSFTARICEKFGLQNTFEIPYRDMRFDNLPTPDIPEPHSIARVYCLDLSTN